MTTTRAALKQFFETGDFPTEVEFADWLDNVGIWTKTTIGFAAFQPDPGNDKTITLFSGVAGTTPQAVKIKHTTSFTGGGITAVVVAIADSVGNSIQGNFDVFQAPGNTVGAFSSAFGFNAIPDQLAASNYTIRLQTLNDVINALVAGSVDVWVLEGPVT